MVKIPTFWSLDVAGLPKENAVLEGLDNVDWDSVEAPEVRRWLKAVASKQHEGPRLTALAALHEYLFSQDLMEGYAGQEQWNQLHHLMAHDIPSLAVPFLIQILKKASARLDKIGLVEILYDLCRYRKMPDKYPTPAAVEVSNWGTGLRETVRTGIDIYRTLLFDEEPDVRTMANELLWILEDDYFVEAWSPWRK